jgi:hypothetical protein
LGAVSPVGLVNAIVDEEFWVFCFSAKKPTIYIVGLCGELFPEKSIPCYWENGVWNELKGPIQSGLGDAGAFDVVSVNDDTYIAGCYFNGHAYGIYVR